MAFFLNAVRYGAVRCSAGYCGPVREISLGAVHFDAATSSVGGAATDDFLFAREWFDLDSADHFGGLHAFIGAPAVRVDDFGFRFDEGEQTV